MIGKCHNSPSQVYFQWKLQYVALSTKLKTVIDYRHICELPLRKMIMLKVVHRAITIAPKY